ncbi:MAG: ribonuclease T [Bosea sp. (in: a-proteobacteria)]|uniref:ribonuclease T2 family protein n=1 Tax=Bosea sp. (in: a-proteobacteria) TaxID=1871050 RepID=UPI002733A463|nr:ribonuclease T [Bosea sp. (in: a-proteobacteria)]MDP3255650.1 ribonuclease T [Bosea sp. (in: a-proteobacteria)]MDP3317722.1 ribonuclease T [Bosea sp. (in: a-proteobacteria)]
MSLLRIALALPLLVGLLGQGEAQPRNDRGGAPGDFDFYVLALSWSPGFCELDGGRDRNREQCAEGAGLGFVVHGLWPQNERGFPSECGPAGRTPSRIALDQAQGLFPSEGLARHQWRKHGTCSGSSPSDYFADTRRAREKITIPPALSKAGREQNWTAIDIERAFVDANPGLRTDMMSVACRRGVLQEVRICLSKDLRNFRMCEEVDRSGCRTRDITVPAPR